MVNRRSILKILSENLTLVKEFGGPTIVSEDITTEPEWDRSQFELIDAKLSITCKQDVTSGADLQIRVNGHIITIVEWHAFETQKQTVISDVPDIVEGGENEILFEYSVTSFNPGGAKCDISDCRFIFILRPLTREAEQYTGSIVSFTKPVVHSTSESILKAGNKITDNVVKFVTIAGVIIIGYYVITKTSIVGQVQKIMK